IVAIHDSGEAAGHFYFVMDYVSGEPLDEWAAARERPVRELLTVFQKVCHAVDAAHLRGVMHRDLKPGNIRVDAAGEPHVLDFGLARSLSGVVAVESPAAMTLTGQFVGTLPWASPEQVEGISARIDIRTDVYSLGLILYHLLTRRLPYDVTGNMRDVADRIAESEPVRPRIYRPGLDDDLETIVLKCLQKEPERRYRSAGELARDVEHYLRQEPIEAKRDSLTYVLRKRAAGALGRHRVAAFAAAVIVAALLAGLLGGPATRRWTLKGGRGGRVVAGPALPIATAPRLEGGGARRSTN